MKDNATTSLETLGMTYSLDTSGRSVDRLSALIRERAYQLFEEGGRQPGRELENWLQAESEIKKRFNV
jgi:hypothetical protein